MSRRILQGLAVAAGMMIGCSAMAQYSVALQTSSACNNTGTVTVDLVLSSAPGMSAAAGAQAFLSYDTSFTCTGIVAGPSLQGIQLAFNNGARTANIAVGVVNNGQVMNQGDVLATLTFTTGASHCAATGLSSFRTNNPPTRLTNALAQAISVTTANLGSVTTNDTTAPVINGGNPLSQVSANADPGVCDATLSVSAPSATDNCGTPSVAFFSRSDSQPLAAPFPVGTTTITWQATDSCGNTSQATQSVVVTDTQAPMITCGATVNANNAMGLCSASLTITPPTATDNCGTPTVSFDSRSDLQPLAAPFPVGMTTITWKATDVNGLMATCTQDVVVTDNEAPTVTPPSAITQNADAGGCTLTLTAAQLGSASVSDNCPGPYGTPIASLTLNGPAIIFPYAFPTGATTVYWRAADFYGNVGQATQIVTVNASNTLALSVDLAGVSPGTMTRCVTIGLYTSGPCALAYTTTTDVTFVNGSGSATLNVPCGSGPYTAMTITDAKHTLRRSSTGMDFGISGVNYAASFTGARALQGGNVNNDEFIDILDFGGYIGQFGTSVGVNSLCTLTGLHADFSGNGNVGIEDFTFITSGFLNTRELDPCGGFIQVNPNQPGGPVTDISINDLIGRGLRSYAMADRNLDGRLNAADVQFVMTHGLSTCAADFNGDSQATVQDLFDFLTAWFGNHPRADINNSGSNTVQDLFDFVGAWFQGC